MKKFILILTMIAGALSVHSQNVGINPDGSSPHASAILDVKSASKGLLIPRIELDSTTDVTTVATPAISLLVYNTATAGSALKSVSPGFYYWGGTAWVKIITGDNGAGTGWKMNGNAGTTPGTDFIGTTDNKSLVFKVNNNLAGHIDHTRLNSFFGFQAGKSITTGYSNVGIGHNALTNLTSGFDNIAIGEGSVSSLTNGNGNIGIGKFSVGNAIGGKHNVGLGHSTVNANLHGNENVAIGHYSLSVGNGPDGNTAIGHGSLGNSNAINNTALGRWAGHWISSGEGNTAIGANTLLWTSSGDFNTAIGFNATTASATFNNATAIGANAFANCNNCIVLGPVQGQNGATSNVSVGIGTTAPTAALDVRRTNTTTANFYGSEMITHFNYGTDEHTFIRGGKSGSHILLNDFQHAGNVGVGTGTPLHKLDVNGDIGVNVIQHASQTGDKLNLFTSNDNAKYGIGVQSHLLQIFTDLESSDVAFGYGTSSAFTEKVRIKGTGRIGIGTNVPAAALDVRRTTNTTANFHGSVHISHFNFGDQENTYIRGGKIGAHVLINDFLNSGNVGIGTSNPGAKLDVAGTVRCYNLVQSSDARLKTNIAPLASSLQKISYLNGYSYQWKDPLMNQSTNIGLLAQEVKAVFPELVYTDERGMLAVSYQGLVPVLLEAVKELKKENEDLRKMRDEINELRAIISSMK